MRRDRSDARKLAFVFLFLVFFIVCFRGVAFTLAERYLWTH
jgi:hypothetical protein